MPLMRKPRNQDRPAHVGLPSVWPTEPSERVEFYLLGRYPDRTPAVVIVGPREHRKDVEPSAHARKCWPELWVEAILTTTAHSEVSRWRDGVLVGGDVMTEMTEEQPEHDGGLATHYTSVAKAERHLMRIAETAQGMAKGEILRFSDGPGLAAAIRLVLNELNGLKQFDPR